MSVASDKGRLHKIALRAGMEDEQVQRFLNAVRTHNSIHTARSRAGMSLDAFARLYAIEDLKAWIKEIENE